MIRVAIAGGTGYTAGELLRLLVRHPAAEVVAVLSTSRAGSPVASVHRDLMGETALAFSAEMPADSRPDVLFMALGHGLSREYLDRLALPAGCRVIDLGNDFRLDGSWRGSQFVYGLTELFRGDIAGAQYIANPGCFATSILLPLAPLAAAGELTGEIHIHAITGSTGSGRTLSETGHFSYRESNLSVYKPFTHQHLDEIEKALGGISGTPSPRINFVPMRGGFTRGIFSSIYTRTAAGTTMEQLTARLKEFYAASPFVHVSDEPVSLKDVINTNKALIHIEEHNGYRHLTTVIDNLLKGASGQAVQNMNVMFGLDEAAGLRLKASAF